VEVVELEVGEGRFCLVQEGLPPGLEGLLAPYLARQRWFAGVGAPSAVEVLESGALSELPTGGRLLWAVVAAPMDRYQLLLAERTSDQAQARVAGHEAALLGSAGGRTYYDAIVDREMAIAFLEAASGGTEHADLARPLLAEQSNTSVVYDERLILKIFRRLCGGPNLDAEVTTALARAGFTHVARPVLRWRKAGTDLAFGQEYLAGGTDGWTLALTSLRDLYSPEATGGEATTGGDLAGPGQRGGDFAGEAERLGLVTAEMHLSMAGAFGTSRDWSSSWARLLASTEADLRAVGPDLANAAQPLFQRFRAVSDLGLAVRPHGDYHLGQVMRTDSGWYVLDFEGEPNRPLEERQRALSPMKDVAGMVRSFDYAAQFGAVQAGAAQAGAVQAGAAQAGAVQAGAAQAGAVQADRAGPGAGGPAEQTLGSLTRSWEARNVEAFVRGYLGCGGIEELLPASEGDREALRLAFELEKVLYELSYERAFRPGWAAIPLNALRRLCGGVGGACAGPASRAGEVPKGKAG
jgi:maltokinase